MNGNESRPQDRRYTKKPQPPRRTIQLTLDVELCDGIELMAQDGCNRSFHNMIDAALRWAVWAHSHGRGPDVEMMEDCHPFPTPQERLGYTKWNDRLREKREARELEQLYKLGEEGRR
ncbi:MAG TPA: hypothetical protein VJW94_18240 [Candidatus Acidoferrum sp.]|nr:hypothetical protein [Candidatus Acidoferrum sp.]